MNEFCIRTEEYRALRSELEMYLQIENELERNCVLAAAITMAWLLTEKLEKPDLLIGWVIPVLIAGLGALRSRAIGKHVAIIGNYLSQLEREHQPAGSAVKGWEHFFAANGRGARATSIIAFWLVFLAVTLAALAIKLCQS